MTRKQLEALLREAYRAGWMARFVVKDEAPNAIDLTYRMGLEATVKRLLEEKPKRGAW